MVVKALDTHGCFLVLTRRVVDRACEQLGEPLKRVLVHWINHCEVHDSEKENLSSERDFSVPLSGFINLFLSDSRLLKSGINLISSDFRVIQNNDEVITFKNGSDLFVLGKSLQDLLFDVSQGLGGLGVLRYDQVLSLLLVRHLLNDKLVEHLLLQTSWSDGEV